MTDIRFFASIPLALLEPDFCFMSRARVEIIFDKEHKLHSKVFNAISDAFR